MIKYMINNGVKNEIKFVNELNNKIFNDVKYNMQLFLEDIFGFIDSKSIIKCHKDNSLKKYDIVVEINGIVKRISLKMGIKNSVHSEPISEFVHFLIECKMPKKLILSFLKYHYADGSTNGTGKNRQSGKEYKISHMDEINEINTFLNQEDILNKAINRFVIKGRNSIYCIDAIVLGTPSDFLWIKTNDIYKVLKCHKGNYSTGIHFSNLFYQPMSRCINKNPKYEKKRFISQIKWYSLFDDIIEVMNNNSK